MRKHGKARTGVFLRILCALSALALLGGGLAMSEAAYYTPDAEEAWYQDMLKAGVLHTGNSIRLKKVVEKARAGERITLAAIGGSITEGAGASQYNDCYAKRFFRGFVDRYGADGGKNIYFVNAGVGGTASTFGLMRFDRDVTAKVGDEDGLADLVIIEFAVNDYQEPTKHRCFESLVKKVLSQPNEPAVILLFSVFREGFTLQSELEQIGRVYDLPMISVRDAAYPLVGSKWTKEAFFFDEYHPTSLGHGVMADCLLYGVEACCAAPDPAQDIDLGTAPAYGDDFMALRTIYGDSTDVALTRGGFAHDDTGSYNNLPVGRVCGENFFHDTGDSSEPLKVTLTFRKLLIAWRATPDARYGAAEILVDGKVKRTLQAGNGSWGQSEVSLLWDAAEPAEHTVEIRMAEGSENKRFTVTAIGYAE